MFQKHKVQIKILTLLFIGIANNLYGCAMIQPMPVSDFNFLTKK